MGMHAGPRDRALASHPPARPTVPAEQGGNGPALVGDDQDPLKRELRTLIQSGVTAGALHICAPRIAGAIQPRRSASTVQTASTKKYSPHITDSSTPRPLWMW